MTIKAQLDKIRRKASLGGGSGMTEPGPTHTATQTRTSGDMAMPEHTMDNKPMATEPMPDSHPPPAGGNLMTKIRRRSSASADHDAAAVQQLAAMGFDRKRAQQVLADHNGSQTEALNVLKHERHCKSKGWLDIRDYDPNCVVCQRRPEGDAEFGPTGEGAAAEDHVSPDVMPGESAAAMKVGETR